MLRASPPLSVIVSFQQKLLRLLFGEGNAWTPTFPVTAQWAHVRIFEPPTFLGDKQRGTILGFRRSSSQSLTAERKTQSRVCSFTFVQISWLHPDLQQKNFNSSEWSVNENVCVRIPGETREQGLEEWHLLINKGMSNANKLVNTQECAICISIAALLSHQAVRMITGGWQ